MPHQDAPDPVVILDNIKRLVARGATQAQIERLLPEETPFENLTALGSALAAATGSPPDFSFFQAAPAQQQEEPRRETGVLAALRNLGPLLAEGATMGGFSEAAAIGGGPLGMGRRFSAAESQLEGSRARAGPTGSMQAELMGMLATLPAGFLGARRLAGVPGMARGVERGIRAERARELGVAGAQQPLRSFATRFGQNTAAGGITGAGGAVAAGLLGEGSVGERVEQAGRNLPIGVTVGAAAGAVPGLFGATRQGLASRTARIQTRNPRIARQLDELTDDEFGFVLDQARGMDSERLRRLNPQLADALEEGTQVATSAPRDIERAISATSGRPRQVVRAGVVRRAVDDIASRSAPVSLSDPAVRRAKTAITALADDTAQAQRLFDEFATVVQIENRQVRIEELQVLAAKLAAFFGVGSSILGGIL